jgi:hypothetical protein
MGLPAEYQVASELFPTLIGGDWPIYCILQNPILLYDIVKKLIHFFAHFFLILIKILF